MTLPPLPEPNVERISGHREPFISYDADQMREYGQQTLKDVLEQAAKLCDAKHDTARTSPGAATADACARRIRKMIGEIK